MVKANSMPYTFIFPGQASQYVGMAADLYKKYDGAKKYFAIANEIMDMDLANICFNGPDDELRKTYLTQPAIFVHSVILVELLKLKGIIPNAVAGHSLGEYSALVAAKVFDFKTGLRLVKERSRLMYLAGQNNPGTMGAIIGLSNEEVADICKRLTGEGVAQPANYNSPGQVAISGDKDTVLKALELAKESGSKKAVELVVSGAFHSPLMQEAETGLAVALNHIEFNDSQIPFYSNVTAQAVFKGQEIKDLLLKQLTSPVRWQEIMLNMIADNYKDFVEVGPGKVLKGLLKRNDRECECLLCDTADQLDMVAE